MVCFEIVTRGRTSASLTKQHSLSTQVIQDVPVITCSSQSTQGPCTHGCPPPGFCVCCRWGSHTSTQVSKGIRGGNAEPAHKHRQSPPDIHAITRASRSKASPGRADRLGWVNVCFRGTCSVSRLLRSFLHVSPKLIRMPSCDLLSCTGPQNFCHRI